MSDKPIIWDPNKDRANRYKHSIGFIEAAEVFFDPLALTVDDEEHSWNERRFITIGKVRSNKILVVAYSENETEIRIISARKPSRTERRIYEEGD